MKILCNAFICISQEFHTFVSTSALIMVYNCYNIITIHLPIPQLASCKILAEVSIHKMY
jgi:hypothetical protein